MKDLTIDRKPSSVATHEKETLTNASVQDLWSGKMAAFTFQYQKLVKPYKDMIAVFSEMLRKNHGMDVLDVGCGSGRLINLINHDLDLKPSSITAIDISNYALEYAQKNVMNPNGCPMKFYPGDVSSKDCFRRWGDSTFDLVTAGLSIHYAQDWDEENQRWTTRMYEHTISEIYRVLRSGGQFLFSVDTPDPHFFVLARKSLKEIFEVWWKSPYMIVIAIALLIEGRKLAKGAKIGRYNYLPIDQTCSFLEKAGFKNITYKLTFADLAWVISCDK